MMTTCTGVARNSLGPLTVFLIVFGPNDALQQLNLIPSGHSKNRSFKEIRAPDQNGKPKPTDVICRECCIVCTAPLIRHSKFSYFQGIWKWENFDLIPCSSEVTRSPSRFWRICHWRWGLTCKNRDLSSSCPTFAILVGYFRFLSREGTGHYFFVKNHEMWFVNIVADTTEKRSLQVGLL